METKISKQKNARPDDPFGRGNLIVRLFVAAVLFLILNASTAIAQQETQDNKTEAAIIYLKKEDYALFFVVKVNNPEGDKFSVTIQNENGESLYHCNSKSKKFVQTFKAFLEGNRVNVVVVNKETKNVVGMFEINVTNKMVEEVLVTRL